MPWSGPGMGPVWRTMSSSGLLIYGSILPICVHEWAPGSKVTWMVAGDLQSRYGISLGLIQLRYNVWVKCITSAECKSIQIAMPAVNGIAMVWSQ